MANKRVIPITDGAQTARDWRSIVLASQRDAGIEIQVQLTPGGDALSPPASSASGESSGVSAEISFREGDDLEGSKRTYWIGRDHIVGILPAGDGKPGDAAAMFSSLEELMTSTRDWRMPQFVSLWNKLPGVRAVKRFENREIAIERVWRAVEKLQEEPKRRQRVGAEKKKKTDIDSKSKRIIALLQAPKGATVRALMEATGWQAHSIRGFLSGTVSKRLGLQVDSFRRDGERVYALRAAVPWQPPRRTAAAENEAADRQGA